MRLFLLLTLLSTACATTIRPGEVGVRTQFGKMTENSRGPGLAVYSPFGTRFIRVPIRTRNVEITLDLPSREGLNVRADVSILYRLDPAQVPALIETVGVEYERSIVIPVFRSAAADMSARYVAKDMHSGERSAIEQAILDRMTEQLGDRGIVVESVLLKSISLPPGLYMAVEDKLEAEQQAQRMEFVLQREELEAERRRIEAAGVRDSQRILAEGLSDEILALRSIEAFQQLSESPNAKIIITDGRLPFLIDPLTQ
ncbi:MAG: regulator of protease activity HflC (stomatin/prohibitin superfamily) [Myxococcota bacterium]|jgi:regulator of protease activity HflC (stomatin/prohibitin superfamily)